LLMCLSVLTFAATYQRLAEHPGEMAGGLATRLDGIYFTLVTLATIGYGDIAPRGQSARLVAILQILYTFIFLTAAATALSRHLSEAVRRHSSHRPSGAARHEVPPPRPGNTPGDT